MVLADAGSASTGMTPIEGNMTVPRMGNDTLQLGATTVTARGLKAGLKKNLETHVRHPSYVLRRLSG